MRPSGPRSCFGGCPFLAVHIRLALRPDSDLDVLAGFDPDHIPGRLGVARMERELSDLFGQKVDLRTPEDLSRHFREQVVTSTLVQYESR